MKKFTTIIAFLFVIIILNAQTTTKETKPATKPVTTSELKPKKIKHYGTGDKDPKLAVKPQDKPTTKASDKPMVKPSDTKK